MAARQAEKEREKEKEKERKQICVGCKKKFTKSDYCVICGMCNYWYHKTCAGMSDDIYKCVEAYCKDNNQTFWNCMPCSTYAKGITARMRELEGRIEDVEKHQGEQDDNIKAVDKRVSETNKRVDKLEKKIDSDKSGTAVLQELRERKSRRFNVIFYGIGEADERASTEEKKTWDRQSCQNVFNALKLRLRANSLKFLRRVGEKGDRPRPLLVGMDSVEDKELLLVNARRLRDTPMSNVGISADLTPMELQEEKDMVAEAERRNKNLTQEDKAKNLKWLVVGQKGEKRLFKGVERTQPSSQRQEQSDRPRSSRDRTSTVQNQQMHLNRGRIGSKRGHSSSGSEGEINSQKNKTKPNQAKKPHKQQPPPDTEDEVDMEEEEEVSQSPTGREEEEEQEHA